MSKFTALLEMKDFADAKKIVETVKISDSARTLLQTAYQIRETQPQIASNFIKTVIQECEDEEKKVSEINGGTSHESSSTTGLEVVSTPEEVTPVESAVNTKDQMGVPIGEMAPPMPPAGGMPPAPPMVPPQAPPVPPQPQQQMQYTIQEANLIRNQFKLVQEAIKAMDKKITETQNSQIKSVEVGTTFKGESMKGNFIRETTGNQERDLDAARHSITKMNDHLNKAR